MFVRKKKNKSKNKQPNKHLDIEKSKEVITNTGNTNTGNTDIDERDEEKIENTLRSCTSSEFKGEIGDEDLMSNANDLEDFSANIKNKYRS